MRSESVVKSAMETRVNDRVKGRVNDKVNDVDWSVHEKLLGRSPRRW